MEKSVAISFDYIYDGIIKDRYARALYWILCAMAKKGRVFVKRKTLSKLTGFHVDRVSKILSLLKEQSVIKNIKRGQKGLVIYLPKFSWGKLTPGKFTVLSHKILLNRRLSIQARIIYVSLRTVSFKGRKYGMDMGRLSTLSGFSRRTLSRYIPQIEAVRLLKVKREENCCNIYQVLDLKYSRLNRYIPSEYREYNGPKILRVGGMVFFPSSKKESSRNDDLLKEMRMMDEVNRLGGSW